MFGDAISWYLTSMAEFWGSAIRIGLPQILLVILIVCWLRRKGGAGACGKRCCWMWCCGRGGDDDEGAGSDWAGDCGCTCGACCRRQGDEADAHEPGDDDE